MAKKQEHSDEQLLEILAKAQKDRDYITRLEQALKKAKKVIKRDKYTPLECPRCKKVFLPHDKRQKYCSKKCATNARVKRFRTE